MDRHEHEGGHKGVLLKRRNAPVLSLLGEDEIVESPLSELRRPLPALDLLRAAGEPLEHRPIGLGQIRRQGGLPELPILPEAVIKHGVGLRTVEHMQRPKGDLLVIVGLIGPKQEVPEQPLRFPVPRRGQDGDDPLLGGRIGRIEGPFHQLPEGSILRPPLRDGVGALAVGFAQLPKPLHGHPIGHVVLDRPALAPLLRIGLLLGGGKIPGRHGVVGIHLQDAAIYIDRLRRFPQHVFRVPQLVEHQRVVRHESRQTLATGFRPDEVPQLQEHDVQVPQLFRGPVRRDGDGVQHLPGLPFLPLSLSEQGQQAFGPHVIPVLLEDVEEPLLAGLVLLHAVFRKGDVHLEPKGLGVPLLQLL